MENKTAKELKQIAKERGVKYYYNMRKSKLITELSDTQMQSVEQMGTKYLLDEPVPDISSTILAPLPFQPITQIRKEINKKITNEKIDELKSTVSNLNQKYGIRNPIEFKLKKSFVKNVTKYLTANEIKGYDSLSFINAAKNNAIKVLNEIRKSKVYIVLTCEMERTDIETGKTSIISAPFRTSNQVVLKTTDLDEFYETPKQKILESLSSFQQLGSGWRFNEDNQCFKWCIARALNPTNNYPNRVDKELKNEAEKINWDKIEFPVSLNQITLFEKNNHDISVNVYGFEKSVYPLRISKDNDRQHLIDLLLISDGEKSHYCLIKSLSRLLSSQTSKRNSAIQVNNFYNSRNCLLGYNSEESLSKHKLYCNTHGSVCNKLPNPGSTMQFIHHNRSMIVPFIVYADFESFIKSINTCTPNPNESYTQRYQKHTPNSFCYYIKCFDESFYQSSPVTFTASSETDDVAQIFVNSLQEDIKKICDSIKFPKKMIFTPENKYDFNAAIKCHICGEDLGKDKVRDHCHITGKYRGVAHRSCNLNYKIPKFFPVLFHNLSGYDSHLFIKKLSGGKLSRIPNNEEKYISFSREIKVDEYIKEGKKFEVKRELRFLDSYRFEPFSLDALSKNLAKDQCKNIGKLYSGKHLDLLLKKSIYPYDWVDSVDKFNETQLPPKELFFSKLNDEDISDDDYSHAQNVWNEFNCKTFRDYHDLYNVSDVLLLADVFVNFREVCMKNYKLDPAWYFTSPGLAWDAALKLTKVKFELLSDYHMILMIKKGIRGGISMISNRLGASNNKYMDGAYDKSKESTFIQYLDANNLYEWAMSKPLPTHGFKWMDENEIENWKSVPCILEVDLDYPESLHDEHNDYPLAPERTKVNKVKKLIPNLNHKKNYVIHYENLKLYERLGLKIIKIHRGIKFEERAWLNKYIELNTNLRTKAKNDFEKEFFKLMNNSVFGKTMENIENRVDVRLINNRDEAVKLASRPNYESRTIFDENLIAIHMKITKLMYNKPIYLLMCILELSKTLMYEFHYDYIMNKYADRAKLLFTDTDTLAYEIKTEDFYADISEDVESKFDTSEFDPKHQAINNNVGFEVGLNKKVLGMFKDETGGAQIEEFIGLRSKLYSYKVHGKEKKKKM
ncbi:uncharacterized protein LOC136080322 [Hydra vulgaris]|uniref:Uncharacterized protein LOC136080322 n=1 Tax=Hydra vulgaris TaxID=6087 RepID=A0ABM4BUZ3_HYDVU